jgi:hypothetical protein
LFVIFSLLMHPQRTIEEEEFEAWHARFRKAVTDLDEIEKQKSGQANEIDVLAAELERDLTLLGVTGVEDKLQEGVPKCIADLAAAQVGPACATRTLLFVSYVPRACLCSCLVSPVLGVGVDR